MGIEESKLVLSIRPTRLAPLNSEPSQPHGLFVLRSESIDHNFLEIRIYRFGRLVRRFGDSDSSRDILKVIEETNLEEINFEKSNEVTEVDSSGNEVISLPPFDGVEVEIYIKSSSGEYRSKIWNPTFYLSHEDSYPGVRGLNKILSVIFPIVAKSEIGI